MHGLHGNEAELKVSFHEIAVAMKFGDHMFCVIVKSLHNDDYSYCISIDLQCH